ncbi:MAG TPA: hypothetical protein PKE39_02685 [Ignavibacteria bacterium]|nr:hypothetical protein [Ignavibacteria bacterium]
MDNLCLIKNKVYDIEDSKQLLNLNEAINTQNIGLSSIPEFKLLSINKVSKMLGIRYETAKKLVRTGKIKGVVTTNNRIKVPYKNLIKYLDVNCAEPEAYLNAIPVEETQNKIDELLKEYV